MNLGKYKIGEVIVAVLCFTSLFVLIAFENKEGNAQRCQSIRINIDVSQDTPSFVSEEQVINQMEDFGRKPLIGKLLKSIDLCELEKKVATIPQIKECEVYGDLKGNIHVKVEQYMPVARILNPKQMGDLYVTEEGKTFPTCKEYTTRVLLLSGSYFNDITSFENSEIKDLVNYIVKDNFWNSQITQIDVDAHSNMLFLPLIGNHKVQFGDTWNYRTKLKKLKIFYDQIAGSNNWDKFETIDVQFKNQIVCK